MQQDIYLLEMQLFINLHLLIKIKKLIKQYIMLKILELTYILEYLHYYLRFTDKIKIKN